jgi:2,3-bisphosphoglycerate-independent phosphoglycerate mutase
MPKDSKRKNLVLIMIDGWGISLNTENNAIRKAQIPGFKNLVLNYPATVIKAPECKPSEAYRFLGNGLDCYSDNHSVSKVISDNNLSQLKISLSRDFPLISNFFNNHDDRLLGEDWSLLTDNASGPFSFLKKNNHLVNLIKHIKSEKYNFILSSFSDIGQEVLKGDFSETVSTVERISFYLEKISRAVLDVNGILVVTSSYGGAEDVYNIGTGIANKKRTKNPVPFLIIGRDYQGRTIGLKEAPNNDISLLSPQGDFKDIAPTILKLMGLSVPESMSSEGFV